MKYAPIRIDGRHPDPEFDTDSWTRLLFWMNLTAIVIIATAI